jgi:hypothetical protein
VLLLPSAEAAVVMRQLDEYTKLVGL